MAYTISNVCISCDACRPQCPVDAIEIGESFYYIDSEICCECIGYSNTAACVEVCPVDCITRQTDG